MKRVLPAFCSLVQRRHDLVQRDLDIHVVVGVLRHQRIVQLEQVDMIHAEAFQALVHAPRDGVGDVPAVGRLEPELGAQHHVGLPPLKMRPSVRSDSPLPYSAAVST
jgi:hypothetical protein